MEEARVMVPTREEAKDWKVHLKPEQKVNCNNIIQRLRQSVLDNPDYPVFTIEICKMLRPAEMAYIRESIPPCFQLTEECDPRGDLYLELRDRVKL
jgi:hypothetical protein